MIYISVIVGQNNENSNLEFSFGRSMHGSGDTPGFHYGFTYSKEFSRKFSWQIGFEGTLNDSPDFPLFYEDPQGNSFDATLHTVTVGFQVVSGVKFNVVTSIKHNFGISILPLIRYQATSLSDIYDTIFPAIRGVPFPVRNIIRFDSG